jgi:spermidine synthase
MPSLEYAEVARAESERGVVVLRERTDTDAPPGTAGVLELRVNGVFVMDTGETSTEEALARQALTHATDPRRVLLGGLGLGFTAYEVLADHRVELLRVAEIEDVLVRWFRDGTVPHGQRLLADERVHVGVGDVRQVVDEVASSSFDLVLLDVDNGPDFLVHDENAALYEAPFLESVRDVLAPGGEVVIWSSTRSEALEDVLEDVFGATRTEEYPVTLQGKQESYWLHSARKDESDG